MKSRISALLLLVLALSFFAGEVAKPKYIFLFIGDGMSIPQRAIAEEFSRQTGRGPLAINSLPQSALTRTASANALITDSAAAATAIACGEKTKNGQLGVSADLSRKLESCAVVAKRNGRKVGIITSVTINHATPAGFYAHQPSRGLMYRIGLDLIASDFDFFGGGGFSGQHDKKDDEMYKGNLYELAQEAGYKVFREKEEILSMPANTGKALALYGEGGLPFAIDGQAECPTLADFTRKGIELLDYDNPNGFFMMVEGGAIDYRGHANEGAGNIKETLAFDDAVKVALEFAEGHKDETLIVVTGDHETGGMTQGFANAGYGLNLALLDNQKCTPETFNGRIKSAKKANPDFSFEDAKELLARDFGFRFGGDGVMAIRENELKELQEAYGKDDLGSAARRIIQNKAGIGWSSGNHTALPVLTTAIGPGMELFSGMLENTDLAKLLKSLM